MKIFAKDLLNAGVALGLLLSVPLASAEDVDCRTIKDAITASEQDFAAFRGARRDLPPDPEMQGVEGLNYTHDEYATERRLAAGTRCSVIVARVEDPESIISESRFVCYWPSTDKPQVQFAAIKKAVQGCAITAQAEDEDTDNYTLNVDLAESGEGWGGISVSVDNQLVETDVGVSVSVTHGVCQVKTPGGCDDA